MSSAETFGKRVRALRKLRGLTQQQLADDIERTSDAISQLERGVNLPSFDTLDRMAFALNVSVKDFFDEGFSKRDAKRSEYIARANALLRDLSDKDLTVAVAQLEALTRR